MGCLRLCPSARAPGMTRGLALHLLGKAAQALQAFEHALTLDDDDPLLWRNLGETLLDPSLRQFQAAAEAFQHALALDDTYDLAWIGLGNAHRFQGQQEAALSAYDTAIKQRPDRPEAWAGRGMVLSDQGRYTEAIESYAQALALDPTDVATQQRLTEVTRRLTK
jgi:tetratricopeptide (TPR) repeat protein